MFKGLSEKEIDPRGKKSSQQSFVSKQTHFTIGSEDLAGKSDKKWASTNQLYYGAKTGTVAPQRNTGAGPDQVQIGGEALALPPQEQYKSETRKAYGAGTSNALLGEKARPLYSNSQLQKAQFDLGNDQLTYKTTHAELHGVKDVKSVPDVQWREDRVRYDIIRNTDIDQQVLKERAFAFDYYDRSKPKGRVTQNHSEIPTAQRIDPITGRRLKY